ncbi:MAG: hypothetical protein MUF51_09470 [Vicinamibacteria bacterium]|nr:hypothetical protein [Vicinamibacteria bacterium]
MTTTSEDPRPEWRKLSDAILIVAMHLLAIPLACAPRRYWKALDEHLPVARMVLISSLLTVMLGFGLGLQGFLRHGQELASAHNTATLDLAYRSDGRPGQVTSAAPVAFNMLAFFSFLLLTPQGWLSGYLVLSGLTRGLTIAVFEPEGDPLLTLGDHVLRNRLGRAREHSAAREREAREGPEQPDLLVKGETLGLECDLVVVASRRKPGWDKGVFVVAETGRYRIAEPIDREFPQGLRALYPLTEARDLEAMRRWVPYQLPAQSATVTPPRASMPAPSSAQRTAQS